MPIEVYVHPNDVPIEHAMVVWTKGERVGVVPHQDTRHLSARFRSSVGACFSSWAKLDATDRKLQLMIEAWHVSAFYEIPSRAVHEALLCIPEYRDMLAVDCLPEKYRHERD